MIGYNKYEYNYEGIDILSDLQTYYFREKMTEHGYSHESEPSGHDMIENFLFSAASRPELTSKPATYPIGTRGSISRVKWPEREADHSHQTSAEVKKTWIYTATFPRVFMAW
jgi:hypothetical protein